MSLKTGGIRGISQVKIGVILSYTLIILNAVYGFVLTPFLVRSLGDAEYGVYKIMSSLTSSLMVLDLGIGGTVMRYVAKYRANKEEDKIPKFLAMMLIQAVVLCGVVAVAMFAMFFAIEPMYSAQLDSAQLQKAKLLFILFAASMLLHIIQNVINGVITGSNRFLFGNGIKIIKLVARFILIISLISVFSDSLFIVIADIAVTLIFLLTEILYILFVLKIKPKLTHWEKGLFFESGKYTILMFLTTIAAQVNNNLDNVIIGAMRGEELVTVYSMGLLIFAMYEQLSTSVSGVMLPTVSKALAEEDGDKKVQDIVVRAGRMQFMLLAAAVVGFACLGHEFLNLWLGKGYEDVYIITLILMIPSLFELCVNVCLAVLRAKNMLTFRTVTLFASTALNAVVTVLAIHFWTYIGAAIGTAVSFVVGSLIVMNIYYYKKLKFPMHKIYLRIFDRIWLCLLISGGVLFVTSRFLYGSVWTFILNVLIFCAVYLLTLLLFGLKPEEKRSLPIIKKLYNRQKQGDTK